MRARGGGLPRLLGAYGLSLGFWLVTSVLVSWQMLRERAQEHLQSVFSDLLLLYAVRYTSVALLTPPLFYLVKRWPITGRSMRPATLYLLGYPLFCLVFALIRWSLLPPWMHETLSWGARSVDNLLRLSYDTFADLFLLYLGVLSAAHAYAYFLRSSQQELEGVEMRQSLVQSELQALRAQIQPHFLFNTLQGISTLIDTDRSMAQDMLAALAALLRTVVKHHSADLVPFRNEARFLQAYLSLERMRLGSRLEVHWSIAEEAYGALIPQLLLQPLVENALVHGIEPARAGGWLRVDVKVEGARLHVIIENSIGGHSRKGFGVGLHSVRQRLKYLYGNDALLEFGVNQEEHTARARLEVPTFDCTSSGVSSSEDGAVPARHTTCHPANGPRVASVRHEFPTLCHIRGVRQPAFVTLMRRRWASCALSAPCSSTCAPLPTCSASAAARSHLHSRQARACTRVPRTATEF